MTAGWKRRAAGAAMALLLLAAVRENGGNAGQDAVRPGGDPAPVRAFTMGPSSVQLPYADDYGPYQWALQNTGTLKLIPGSHPAFRPGSDGADAAGTDGPDRESRESVRSVAGIDLNLIPAWKQYDAVSEKREVVVALIDTGVDAGHPDLAGSLWVNVDEIPGDGIDNDGNGYVDDVNGWNFYDGSGQIFTGASDTHGTHSAGTIAAAPNGSGTIGICDPAYVKIMVLKILGGSQGVGTTEHVTEAIRYAQENGASICNLSFGTPQYSRELYEAIRDSGMLFVVAAGNGNSEGQGYDIDETPVYPASFDLENLISVASLQLDGTLDPASNFGGKSVDLAAPGSYILSTVPGGGYRYMSGTSMAAPMVTGAAALLYSADPSLTGTEVRARLFSSAKRLDSLAGRVATGGMPDVSAALQLSQNGS